MSADADPGLRVSRAAYRVETVPVLRQRLSVAMAIFVFFMGIGTFFEATVFPERASLALLLYGLEALVAIGGSGACWLPRMRARSETIAALTAVTLLACINAYHATVHAQAERVATVLGCVLNTLSVLLPWGWGAQAVVALGSFASFAVAAPHFVTQDALAIPAIVLAAAGTTSVWGAFFLDRYRFEAFRRTALETEEAEIAAALAHVGETLSKHLGEADALERVNHLAVDVLGCDFSSLFLFDERRGAYWLASNVGSHPEVRAELKQLEFPPDSLPLLRALRPGELIAIPDASRETLVPPEMSRRFEVASELVAPVARGDHIIGVLVVGFRDRVGTFSSRERRLTLGIAHATAITLENGRLIADLQTANRLKSEFVATMSHELRTPINVIMGYSEMLADGLFDPSEPEWTGTIARIQEHALELLQLVNATLDMGRLESGRETVTIADVDIGRLLADLGRELKPLAQPGITLSWSNDLGAPSIVTDAVKLKTILKNLIGNALKFTSAGSVHVGVVLDHDPEGEELVVFSVRDTGIGIAPEHLSVIFEMFRQVDSSSTRRFSGVGLGLHIARRLVDLLGGTIQVESTPGTGSTFSVSLPLRRGETILADAEPVRAMQ
jgi:signal transduction histidine kinase